MNRSVPVRRRRSGDWDSHVPAYGTAHGDHDGEREARKWVRTPNKQAVEGYQVRRERDQGTPHKIFLKLMRKQERCRSIEAVSRPDLYRTRKEVKPQQVSKKLKAADLQDVE